MRSISKVISVSINVLHLLHPLFVVEHFQFVPPRFVHEIKNKNKESPSNYSHSFASWIRTTISAFKAPRPAVRRRQNKPGRLD
jgi:hypothetical protein